jgi:hypothetical protein
MVVINRHIEKTVESPLPDALYIVAEKDGWLVTKDKPSAPRERLHFPGGAMALFHGEPIMVVWGTGGDEKTNKRIYDVAQISRQMCRPGWPEPTELVDGIPMVYSIYGRLPGKPDSEVTQADMEKYNLLLIGTAKQNSVVAKLSKDLPVKIKDGRIVTDDGLSWDYTDCAVGLLYYNPFAPNRLIYWAGSDSVDFYQTGTPLLGFQYWDMAAPDLLVLHATDEQIIAARRFDSRWVWEKGYADSPLMDKELCIEVKYDQYVAKRLRQKTGADLTLYTTIWQSSKPAYSPGQTRQMDALAMPYYERVVMMELSGQDILDDMKNFAGKRDGEIAEQNTKRQEAEEKGIKFKDEPIRTLCFFPQLAPEDIEPEKTYSVAAHNWNVRNYVETTNKSPKNLRHLAITMRDVLK